ncbi:hypothetical protein D9619_006190 [Psilocybe cf. subviscida]|uniref:Glucose-methanol-choline oxidoreductase C-terminal domain-containing protein n=1 Tax=Psilocybe cf. subviscida TaxID=2480587 RepID=A0A8H5B4V7_9AGAR|nr:hypothetical protein D9619_006190 [Psilocybe cf. subviscida]
MTRVSFQSPLESSDRVLYQEKFRREVIVCAGPIAALQILLLSKTTSGLESCTTYLPPTPCTSCKIAAPELFSSSSAILHLAKVSSWHPLPSFPSSLTPPAFDDLGNIVKFKSDNRGPSGLPDLEILPVYFNYSDPPVPFEDVVFSLNVGLMRPASRGSVSLASANPLDGLVCDLAFLTDTVDFAVLRKGIKLAKRIGEKMRERGMSLKDLYMPESESDADLDAFVCKTARTKYHYGCTCRMAPENDVRPGVVDDELRVHGVKNLRIADTSLIPDMTAAHLQAPAIMIAEKCADMVKAACC